MEKPKKDWREFAEFPTWDKEKFRQCFCQIRTKYEASRRDVAYLAGIDPSYITLIEKSGSVPSRKFMHKIVWALESLGAEAQETNILWLSAGYVPPQLDHDLLTLLSRFLCKSGKEQKRILKEVLRKAVNVPAREQPIEA
jgi:transcriptional regulator with XRE-family HTH domain